MSGRINILRALMSISPGKDMSIMVDSEGSMGLSMKPKRTPNTTPTTVNTSRRLSLHHDVSWKKFNIV